MRVQRGWGRGELVVPQMGDRQAKQKCVLSALEGISNNNKGRAPGWCILNNKDVYQPIIILEGELIFRFFQTIISQLYSKPLPPRSLRLGGDRENDNDLKDQTFFDFPHFEIRGDG